MIREIQEVRRAHDSRDGAGVAIRRISAFGHTGMDPILMLDELRSEHREDFAAGFPPHPHRGMQTLTYMKEGGLIHEDNQGNRGEIRSGGAQYMSAGRGIIHSEMPTQDSQGLHGFQLWINLPAAQKMSEPRYRDVEAAEIPGLAGEAYKLQALAGDWELQESQRAEGPLVELAPQAALADVQLQGDTFLRINTELEETVMVYVYAGGLHTSGGMQSETRLLIYGEGEELVLHSGTSGAGVLVLRGRPIGEPVAHYGPFVMNSDAEIEIAISDYQSGRFVA